MVWHHLELLLQAASSKVEVHCQCCLPVTQPSDMLRSYAGCRTPGMCGMSLCTLQIKYGVCGMASGKEMWGISWVRARRYTAGE
jgi:hypothetical protein